MPAKFYSNTMSSSTSDLLHKLGFSNQPSYDRKQEIETNMNRLQEWLDDDDGYDTSTTTEALPPPPDSIMGRPAVLIASTGSIRKKRRRLAARAARSKVASSGSSTRSGLTQSDSSSLNTNVDTLESFPIFVSSSTAEMEAEVGAEEYNKEAEKGGGIEVSKQAGLLGTFGRLWRIICRS